MNSYLAIVPTAYTTYAVADTASKARTLALKSAMAWLTRANASHGITEKPYKSLKELEDYLGCNIYEIPFNGAIQEG